MTSLLELQEKRAELRKKIVNLGFDTIEYANTEWNLRDVEKTIRDWGTKSGVQYRIM